MILILKLLAPLATLIVAICQFLLNYKWNDKRTNSFKRGHHLLFIAIVVAALFSIAIIYFDEQSSHHLVDQLKTIQVSNDSLRSLVNIAEKRGHSERNILQNEIKSLNNSLEPFRKLASKRFSDLSEGEALSRLAKDVEQLGKKLESEIRNVKTLSAQVELKIKANWLDDKPPDVPMLFHTGGGADTWLDIRDNTGKTRRLELFGARTPSIKADKQGAVVSYLVEAAADSWVIGSDPNQWSGCSFLRVVLYTINSSLVKDNKVKIDSIRLDFYINGKPRLRLEKYSNKQIELAQEEGSTALQWGGFMKFVRYNN